MNYFWGGKSLVLGWDARWGTPKEVWAAGSPSTGTVRPYGLDCSGFVDWVFYNISGGTYVIGHGGGAHMQHTYCTPITWDEAIPGDLVFYPEDTHVGIKDTNFHALRHTFATRSLEQGMDVVTLSRLLGHANPSITMDKYGHALDDHKRASIGKLDGLYAGAKKKPAPKRGQER